MNTVEGVRPKREEIDFGSFCDALVKAAMDSILRYERIFREAYFDPEAREGLRLWAVANVDRLPSFGVHVVDPPIPLRSEGEG